MTERIEHAEMLDLIIEQYKGDQRLRSFIGAHLTQGQQIEDAARDVEASRDVDQATGVSLDMLGSLVGQGREGASDADYRILIKARVLVNSGNGRGDEMIALLQLAVISGTWAFGELYPAAISVRINGETDSAAATISRLIRDLSGAGIGTNIAVGPADGAPETPFFYNTTTGSVITAPGYDTTTGTETDGGEFSRSI